MIFSAAAILRPINAIDRVIGILNRVFVLSHLFDVFHLVHVLHALEVLPTYFVFSHPGWQVSTIFFTVPLVKFINLMHY